MQKQICVVWLICRGLFFFFDVFFLLFFLLFFLWAFAPFQLFRHSKFLANDESNKHCVNKWEKKGFRVTPREYENKKNLAP